MEWKLDELLLQVLFTIAIVHNRVHMITIVSGGSINFESFNKVFCLIVQVTHLDAQTFST